jgi:hypothetical protein
MGYYENFGWMIGKRWWGGGLHLFTYFKRLFIKMEVFKGI